MSIIQVFAEGKGIVLHHFSCFFAEPEPILLERNYTFVFTCPNIKFNPVDLKDCFNQSGLCSRGDISLCDNPFQRVYDNISSTDTHILATLKGTLPYVYIYFYFVLKISFQITLPIIAIFLEASRLIK